MVAEQNQVLSFCIESYFIEQNDDSHLHGDGTFTTATATVLDSL